MQNLVTIYAEATPNPNTMKFVANRYLLPRDTKEFTNAHETIDAPIAAALFDFPFVKNVFISNNYITITKPEQESWDEIIPMLKDFLKQFLESGNPLFIENKTNHTTEAGDDNPIIQRIKQILNDYIAPAVEQDGGAIQFRKWEPTNGLVTVVLRGSCSGCPSSMITLKAGIENLLRRMIPEVNEVVAENA